ncbi:MAG: hypothetical protein MST00_02405 [Tenericutes bacterium]|nr:hypothetical protein [Mycoplasmatota bacterium]
MKNIKKLTYLISAIVLLIVILLMLIIHTFNHTEVSAPKTIKTTSIAPLKGIGC